MSRDLIACTPFVSSFLSTKASCTGQSTPGNGVPRPPHAMRPIPPSTGPALRRCCRGCARSAGWRASAASTRRPSTRSPGSGPLSDVADREQWHWQSDKGIAMQGLRRGPVGFCCRCPASGFRRRQVFMESNASRTDCKGKLLEPEGIPVADPQERLVFVKIQSVCGRR